MSRIPNLASERGAVLVQTAIAALVLVGFGTFVVDYGVLWVGRHQAQNAADAGAMAGAVARAYEDFNDPPDPAWIADQNASEVAGANLVWGQPAAAAAPIFDVCPPDVLAPRRCVRVDVYRDSDHGNPLPTWFASVFGITSQGVKATATAQVVIPNATNCLRPWAIPDSWTELSVPGDPSFRKYADATGVELPLPHDVYDAPTPIDRGTGLAFPTSNAVPGDLGLSVPLTFDDLVDPLNRIYRSSVVPLELPGGYAASIAACNGQPVTVGDQILISTAPATANAGDFSGLYDQDSGASWNTVSRTIDGSCAPGCAPLSPRLVAVAVFDVELFQYRKVKPDWNTCPPGAVGCTPCPGGLPCVSIVNIVGFFIGDSTGSSGYLTTYPGVIPKGPPLLSAESSFLKAVTLVR